MATKYKGDEKILEKYRDVLNQMPLFMGIAPADVQGLINCLNPKLIHYKKNQYIVFNDSPFMGIGNLVTGSASVIKENLSGHRIILTILNGGDIFGEMAAFSSSPVWPATVQAQEACDVFFLPANKILGQCNNICAGHRQLIQNLLRIITAKAMLLNRKVEYLSIKSMRGKIAAFLLEQYHNTGKTMFMLPMKRNELADFLNVSRPSMSRELCRMRDEKIIDFHLATIRILDIARLMSWIPSFPASMQ